jgi:hypothetical protein
MRKPRKRTRRKKSKEEKEKEGGLGAERRGSRRMKRLT